MCVFILSPLREGSYFLGLCEESLVSKYAAFSWIAPSVFWIALSVSCFALSVSWIDLSVSWIALSISWIDLFEEKNFLRKLSLPC